MKLWKQFIDWLCKRQGASAYSAKEAEDVTDIEARFDNGEVAYATVENTNPHSPFDDMRKVFAVKRLFDSAERKVIGVVMNDHYFVINRVPLE